MQKINYLCKLFAQKRDYFFYDICTKTRLLMRANNTKTRLLIEMRPYK